MLYKVETDIDEDRSQADVAPKRSTESSNLQSGILWQLVHVGPLMSTILGITFSGH